MSFGHFEQPEAEMPSALTKTRALMARLRSAVASATLSPTMTRRSALALALFALGCDDAAKPPPTAAPSATPAVSSAKPEPPLPSARSIEREEPPFARDAGVAALGEVVEVGPAGPATASARGIVAVTKADELVLAPLRGKKAAISRIQAGADMLRPNARGPAVAGDFAYWISKGRLVRRHIENGALEVLANDARDGVRVAAALTGSSESARAVAAYVADEGDSTRARLWVERGETFTITPEGSAATSVALAVVDSRVFALSIEARTGMTPVHARVVDLSGTPKLEEDVVVWVTGPAQSLVEIAAIAEPAGAVSLFVPLERDITRFGLAHVRLGNSPKMGSPVTWRAYPNGLDPAPLAAETTCGSASLLYTLPSEAKPGAAQELVIARLENGKLGPPELVARSRAVINVSLADTPHGALVSFVAEARSWATVVPCPAKR